MEKDRRRGEEKKIKGVSVQVFWGKTVTFVEFRRDARR